MCKVLRWNLKPFWNKAVKWQRNCNMMWKKWSAANTFWCTVVYLLSTRWCCSVCNVAAVLYSYLSSYLWESEDVPATCTEQVRSTRGENSAHLSWALRCVHSNTLGSWTPLKFISRSPEQTQNITAFTKLSCLIIIITASAHCKSFFLTDLKKKMRSTKKHDVNNNFNFKKNYKDEVITL